MTLIITVPFAAGTYVIIRRFSLDDWRGLIAFALLLAFIAFAATMFGTLLDPDAVTFSWPDTLQVAVMAAIIAFVFVVVGTIVWTLIIRALIGFRKAIRRLR
jgi:hypothetical protein